MWRRCLELCSRSFVWGSERRCSSHAKTNEREKWGRRRTSKLETGPFRLLPCGRLCLSIMYHIQVRRNALKNARFVVVPVIAQQLVVATVPKEEK